MAGKRSIRLEGARDVKKALARLFNQLMRGEIDGQTARDGTYVLRAIVEVQDKAEVEEQMEDFKNEPRLSPAQIKRIIEKEGL